jgi:hypothetical protein
MDEARIEYGDSIKNNIMLSGWQTFQHPLTLPLKLDLIDFSL